MTRSSKFVINGAFRGQRITGQQRYASEIAKQLLTMPDLDAKELTAAGWWQKSPMRAWLWVQLLPYRVPRKSQILTLTSRGPVICRRQVIVIHDLFVLTNPEWFSRKYLWTHAPILKLQMKYASAIITVSEPVAAQVRERVSKKTPVIVASNAPSEVFRKSSSELDRIFLESKGLIDGKFVLTVASLDPRKNIQAQVKAYLSLSTAQRKKCPLVLVGGENSSFNNVLLDIDETVIRLGYVSDEELGALYRSAKFLAFPTMAEGFGLPAVEALATGTPVLTSDIPIMRWVCGPHASYIDPGSQTDMARGLCEMMEDETESTEKRHSRSEYVLKNFSWRNSATEIAVMLDRTGLVRQKKESRTDEL